MFKRGRSDFKGKESGANSQESQGRVRFEEAYVINSMIEDEDGAWVVRSGQDEVIRNLADSHLSRVKYKYCTVSPIL